MLHCVRQQSRPLQSFAWVAAAVVATRIVVTGNHTVRFAFTAVSGASPGQLVRLPLATYRAPAAIWAKPASERRLRCPDRLAILRAIAKKRVNASYAYVRRRVNEDRVTDGPSARGYDFLFLNLALAVNAFFRADSGKILMFDKIHLVFPTLLAACAVSVTTAAQPASPQDRYIVVLAQSADVPAEVAADLARATGGRVGYVFSNVLNGFSITMPRTARASLARNPRVAYVEEDIPVTAFGQTVPTGVERIFADYVGLGIDEVDDSRVDVDVAVLDTGIDRQHLDLNVVGGANCLGTTGGGPPWARSSFCDDLQDGDDDHYHGTHVAGTIGALDNGIGVVGVAPGARLWAVKVLDQQGSGSLSGIIAGIDWVVAQTGIEVINMSLGGSGTSQAMNDAVANAVSSGVTVVVAAGNDDANASGFTPANAPDAITVSALADFDGDEGGLGESTCRSDQDDTLADFSNWGAVDIAAPGACILSTYPIERGEYNTISGTSMASPHVAGAAALLASNGADPITIRGTLLATGNLNWTDDSGDDAEEPLLDISAPVFIPAFEIVGGGNNSAPTASFSYSCIDLSCSFMGSGTDSDGSIVSYTWDFGDSSTSTSQTPPSHTYGAGGTYTVKLTVADDDDATGSQEKSVTVSEEPTSGGIALTVSGYKVKGVKTIDLSWSGVSSSDVDIHRDGIVLVEATENVGAYTDNTGEKGGGSYTYKICEASSTTTCSNEMTATF
jgi:subtilisin